MEKAKVYFTKDISSDSLLKIYEQLGIELPGKVGVKVSTGEDGAKGYLKADLIGPLVKKLNGTIVECNTAYPGARNTAEDHYKVAEKHGFTSFAEVDIMDENGINEPILNDLLKEDKIGQVCNYPEYLCTLHQKIQERMKEY